MTSANQLPDEFPWVTVFMDLALRAIREVHHAHMRLVVGQQWEMNRPRSSSINKGPGIALADERTVCAAITQEFSASSAVSGIWKDGKRAEIRFFDIKSEAKYLSAKGQVDLFIKKHVVIPKSLKLKVVRRPSFIEAKRARLQYPISESSKEKIGKLQTFRIRQDICKLRKEKEHREKNKRPINAHILVWGVYSTASDSDSPSELFNGLKDSGLTLRGIRSLPLDWHDPDFGQFTLPKVTRALWLLLAEVDAKKKSTM